MKFGKSWTIKTTFIILFLSGLLCGPLNGLGQAQDLSRALEDALNQSWRDLSPKERSRALENYQRFQKLSPKGRRGIEERYHRWQQLPDQERDRIRRNYKRYRDMDSDEKEEFNRKYKRWRSRPRD